MFVLCIFDAQQKHGWDKANQEKTLNNGFTAIVVSSTEEKRGNVLFMPFCSCCYNFQIVHIITTGDY